MSGGFFRGTSAEQDTRFSNKMEKLLKTQKFAPELDQLVDMSKVKIDVIRPWIAKRVTDLLGFEDEVLINFIYGLLEGKVADGKHIQIQLTGFMEKNTGKFMRELWSLLTSAQNTISGVPQQLLDAKAEEARKKKAEDQRIVSEVMRKKDEEKATQQERERKLVSESEAAKAAGKPNPNRSPRIDAQDRLMRIADTHTTRTSAKNGVSRHPDSNERSPYGRLHGRDSRVSARPSHSKSSSRSSSSSQSLSRSPVAHRRYLTGSVPQSPHRFRHSKSPARRGRSPRRRHSPMYSHSPPRKRPSVPWGHPRFRRRSPAYARSPRRRPVPSSSPPRHRPVPSSSPPRHYRSQSNSDSSPPTRNLRSPVKIPYHSHRRSLSRERGARYNGSESRTERDWDNFSNPRVRVNSRVNSPEIRSLPEQQQVDRIVQEKQDQAIVEQDNCITGDHAAVDAVKNLHTLTTTIFPPGDRRGSGYEEASTINPSDTHKSPLREECPQQVDINSRIKQSVPVCDNETVDRRDDHNRQNDNYVPHISRVLEQAQNKGVIEPLSVKEPQVISFVGDAGDKMCYHYGSEKGVGVHEILKRQRSPTLESTSSEEKRLNAPKRVELNICTEVADGFRKLGGQREELVLPAVKSDLDVGDFVVGQCGRIRTQRPRTEEKDLSSAGEDEDESGSPSEERQKSKKRRKEEKRLRKEERRKKREERHRRKEEKRAARASAKAVASVTPPPDFGRDVGRLVGLSDYDSGGEEHRSEEDDMESEQKRLENELRKKALDSLRAKKAIQS